VFIYTADAHRLVYLSIPSPHSSYCSPFSIIGRTQKATNHSSYSSFHLHYVVSYGYRTLSIRHMLYN